LNAALDGPQSRYGRDEKKRNTCFCGKPNSPCLTRLLLQEMKVTLLDFVKIEMSDVFKHRTVYETENDGVPS
jgi:predicted metal-binding transcription factor (methanogenesis marker protein 9)